MAVSVGWIEPPKYKKGLDPLGVQQPCIALYSILLPGVTNVTDRIAYFGFGPWFTWAFSQRYPKAKATDFAKMLRRAEVMLTLIAVRHALVSKDGHFEEHAGAMVGVNTLQPVSEQMTGKTILRPSAYAGLEESPRRYFKNPRGGLGQYYLGVLRDEYHLLGERKDRVIDFTLERGQPMAEAVGVGVEGTLFFRCLENDRVSSRELDTLVQFCPCQLRAASRSSERQLLLDTVLGRRPELSDHPDMRRRSLALIVDFLRAAAGGASHFESGDDFLVATYSNTLPNGNSWSPAETLTEGSALWGFYFRGEILSVAMQRLFREALGAIGKEPANLMRTVEEMSLRCTSTDMFAKAAHLLKAKTFEDLLRNVRAKLPPLSQVRNARHEVNLWERVRNQSDEQSNGVEVSARLVATLIARHENAADSLQNAIGTNGIQIDNYPINVDSIFKRARTRWSAMTMTAWMTDMVFWLSATHRQIAFRKLSQTGDDTRRLLLGDDGFYVVDLIDVARTMPRLRPALRFLRDLGLIKAAVADHLPLPTTEGLKFLQQVTNG